MKFEKTPPTWNAEGSEPPSSLKTSGFQAGYKPPAAYFNWFWNKVSACLTELQTKLSNVDNTKDAEKSVKYASTSGSANKTKGSMVVHLNGGSTEGTDQFTFDGSTGKSVNITADKIGAAKKDGKSTIIAATSTDGIAYTATLDGITELFDGLKITIIPDKNSASTAVTLDLNGLGAKKVRITLPFNSSNSGTMPKLPTWMGAGSPLTLTYHSKFQTWKTELQMASGSDIYGKVPIQSGGTYANSETTEEDKAKARQDLGIETVNGTTVNQNADYAEVGEWADGNPNSENRIGYFVAIDDTQAGTTIIKATSTKDVRGVVVTAPAFSGNCSADKFDSNGNLLKQYAYVAVMGLVSVIDNGTCTINERCMPNDSGTAVPSSNNLGYQVIDRIDDTHILIAVEPGADMIQRIRTDVAGLQNDIANRVRYDAAQSLTDTQKAQARTNINAAPGGFGLGQANMELLEDCNNAILSGWYFTDTGTVNTPGEDGNGGVLCVSRRFDKRIYQEFHTINGNEYSRWSATRISYGNDSTGLQWGPWEWINPPMYLNTEYRTTERYLGKPVYCKLIDFGALPDSTTKKIAHGIQAIDKIVRAYATASNSTTNFNGHTWLPQIYNNSLSDRWTAYIADLNATNITIYCGVGLAGCSVYVTVYYTKTTD